MSSYSSLLSASGKAFGVERGCSESGENCIPLEVHERVDPPGRVGPTGRVGSIKCCCEGCILFEVVPFGRAEFCSRLGGFTGVLGEVVVPPSEGIEITLKFLNNMLCIILTYIHTCTYTTSHTPSCLSTESCSLIIGVSSIVLGLLTAVFAA